MLLRAVRAHTWIVMAWLLKVMESVENNEKSNT